MRCPFCNKENPGGAEFCGSCGKRLRTGINSQGAGPDGYNRRKSGRSGKKRWKRWLIAAAAVVVLVVIVLLFSFPLSGDEDAAYIASIENYCEVNEQLVELTGTEDYTEAATEQKAVIILECLDDLVLQGEISEGTISYDGENQIVSYRYLDGTVGGVILEEAEEGTTGAGRDAYVTEYDERGFAGNTDNVVFLDAEGYPYEEEDLSAIVIYGLGDGFEAAETLIDEMAQIWEDEHLFTMVEKDGSVSKLRTELLGYDLVVIQLHGTVDQDVVIMKLQEQVSLSVVLNELSNSAVYSLEDALMIDDLRADYVRMYLSGGTYSYYLTPDFFENYYSNGQLRDTIIWIGSCSGYNNDSLVSALAECGAEAVLGCTESVKTAYNLVMQDAFVYSLLYGYTVDESLSWAKSIWGDNDRIYWARYAASQENYEEDDSPSEIRYYNGGDATLVTLASEADSQEDTGSTLDNPEDSFREILSEDASETDAWAGTYVEEKYGISDTEIQAVYTASVVHEPGRDTVESQVMELDSGYDLGAVFYRAVEDEEDGSTDLVCVYLDQNMERTVFLKLDYLDLDEGRSTRYKHTITIGEPAMKSRSYCLVTDDCLVVIEMTEESSGFDSGEYYLARDLDETDSSLSFSEYYYTETVAVYELDEELDEIMTFERTFTPPNPSSLEDCTLTIGDAEWRFYAGYSSVSAGDANLLSTEQEICDKANEILEECLIDDILIAESSWENRWDGVAVNEEGIPDDMVKVDFTCSAGVSDGNGNVSSDVTFSVNAGTEQTE